jgi:hypothetical protein
MNAAWQSIKQHPFSGFFYIIYCLLWGNAYSLFFHPMREGGLFAVAGFFTAIVFIAISLLNAYQTDEYTFYLWFIAFIALPVIAEFFLNYIYTINNL